MDYYIVPKGEEVWNRTIKPNNAILFGKMKDNKSTRLTSLPIINTYNRPENKLIKTCVR